MPTPLFALLGQGSAIGGSFTGVDWTVVVLFLAGTTWLGARLAGRQESFHDFFLSGRRLPWYAVAGSIIATEISGVTLISLPSVVFKPGGNLTYLQTGVFGLLLARWVVAFFLVPAYYEREIYSPYDYMGARLGPRVRGVTTALFSLGGVLAQSARVYLVAVVLEVILYEPLSAFENATGIPPLASAVAAIALVSVGWTLLGGIATVVWTDVVLFFVFLASIAIAVVTAVGPLEEGLGGMWSAAGEARKLEFFDFRTHPRHAYTLWAALFAVSWQGIAVFGTDQMFAQRILCCRTLRDAQKAVLVSYGSMIVAVLVAFVGLGLYAYYREFPLTGLALELYEKNPDRIFPLFIVQVIPVGWKGFILAGVFAAAISSLDSILAALSQTTVSAAYLPWKKRRTGVDAIDDRSTLRVSRALVVFYGVLLALLAIAMESVAAHYDSILDLALAMAGYTQGALLAGFLLAFLRLRVDGSGYLWSAPLSVLAVYAVAWRDPAAAEAQGAAWLLPSRVALVAAMVLAAVWLGVRVLAGRRGSEVLPTTIALAAALAGVLLLQTHAPPIAWPWFVPIGCTTAFVFGLLLDRRFWSPRQGA